MKETGIRLISQGARSYQRENGNWINSPFENASQTQGAGSLYSTLRDSMKLDSALRNGKLLKSINNSYVGSWSLFGFSDFPHGWGIKHHKVLGRVAMHLVPAQDLVVC